jgi:hypothetical protein
VICPHCRAAAAAAVEDDGPVPDEVLLGVFQQELHEQCRGGGWCECQHRVADLPMPTSRLQELT